MRLATSGTARFRPRLPADHPIDVTHRIGGIRDDILFLLVVSVAVRPLTWTRAVARSAGSHNRPAWTPCAPTSPRTAASTLSATCGVPGTGQPSPGCAAGS